MSGQALSAAAGLCDRGVKYFGQLPGLEPRAWVSGQAVPLEVAIGEAASILCASLSPGVLGLDLVSIEACEAAVRLAGHLRGWLCPWPPDPVRSWGQLAPDLLQSRAEVEDAADLIICVGGAPDEVQPRFGERHLRRGRGDGRRVLVLSKSTLEEVMALRLHFEQEERLPEVLVPLAVALSTAECVQVFFATNWARQKPEIVRQWQTLAARQRQKRRFGLAPLGETGRGRTVTEALTWLTGFPGPVWFGGPKPLYRPGVGEADVLVARRALDSIVWVGSRSLGSTATGVREIHISVKPSLDLEVAIEVAGLDPRLDAHVVREDGILLRLAGATPGAAEPTASVLSQIASALEGGRP
jgi:formylmethanofuran dehydrogenase subunit B